MKTKIILIAFMLLFLSANNHLNAQGYPASPSEIGIIGAGLTYSDLTPYGSTGTVYLNTGVYEMIDFQNANIVINGPNVVLKKCRILWDGNGNAAIRNYSHHIGLIIEDSEINGQENADAAAIFFRHYKLIRTWVHNIGNDGVKANGDVTIHRCWIGPLTQSSANSHNDCLQIDNNSYDAPVVVTCSVFEGKLVNGQNINVNCLRFGNSGPNGIDVVAVGNKLIGAGYQLSVSSLANQSFKVKDNYFESDWTYGPVYPTTPVNYDWSNNKDSNGNLISVPNTSVTSGTSGSIPNISYQTCDCGGCCNRTSDFASTVGKPAFQQFVQFISKESKGNLKNLQHTYIEHEDELNTMLTSDDPQYYKVQSYLKELRPIVVVLMRDAFFHRTASTISNRDLDKFNAFLLELSNATKNKELYNSIEAIRASLFVMENKPVQQALIDLDQADLSENIAAKNLVSPLVLDEGISFQLIHNTNIIPKLMYTSQETGKLQIQVFDINGKLVKTILSNSQINKGQGQEQIDTRDFENGIYLIQAVFTGKQGPQEYSGKLVVSN